jgi:hypothetical protein
MDQLTKTILAWERRLERQRRSHLHPAPGEASARANRQDSDSNDSPRRGPRQLIWSLVSGR